jgi:pyruvate ferredoxin oxidoreductase alpha subunit
VLLPGDYTFFRHQHHMASMNALGVLREVQREFARKFGRNYGLVEEYCTEGANTIIVTQGSISTTAKAAVNAMRKRGKRVGLLRLRVIRPWPEKEVGEALANAKHVAMFNKDLAPGRGGIMSPEVKAAMYKAGGKAVVTDFIAGLGGNPESVGMFEYAVKLAEKDRKGEVFWLD